MVPTACTSGARRTEDCQLANDMPCLRCGADRCTCLRGKPVKITIEIDQETYDALKQEALCGTPESEAARILIGHYRRPRRRPIPWNG